MPGERGGRAVCRLREGDHRGDAERQRRGWPGSRSPPLGLRSVLLGGCYSGVPSRRRKVHGFRVQGGTPNGEYQYVEATEYTVTLPPKPVTKPYGEDVKALLACPFCGWTSGASDMHSNQGPKKPYDFLVQTKNEFPRKTS